MMLLPSKTDKGLAPLVIESSLPLSFFERIDEVAPLPARAKFNTLRTTILPVVWSIDRLVSQSKLIGAKPPCYIHLYNELKLEIGILYPITSIDGRRHVLRYDGSRPDLTQEEINDLGMLSAHFLNAFERSMAPSGTNAAGLSEREIDVIHWSATGKTSSEIAAILALSNHTVNAYMKNAFKKMDCVNRAQLVAKALRMRVIS